MENSKLTFTVIQLDHANEQPSDQMLDHTLDRPANTKIKRPSLSKLIRSNKDPKILEESVQNMLTTTNICNIITGQFRIAQNAKFNSTELHRLASWASLHIMQNKISLFILIDFPFWQHDLKFFKRCFNVLVGPSNQIKDDRLEIYMMIINGICRNIKKSYIMADENMIAMSKIQYLLAEYKLLCEKNNYDSSVKMAESMVFLMCAGIYPWPGQ